MVAAECWLSQGLPEYAADAALTGRPFNCNSMTASITSL